MSDSSVRPDAVIHPAGRLEVVTSKEQRLAVMQRAETWIEHVGPLRPVENSIIRDLLMELALLDGAYELLSNAHRVGMNS